MHVGCLQQRLWVGVFLAPGFSKSDSTSLPPPRLEAGARDQAAKGLNRASRSWAFREGGTTMPVG